MGTRQSEGRPQDADTPLSEWIIGALGTLLVLAVIGYLLYRAFTGSQSPPAISLHVESVQRSGAGHLVRLVARNDGDQAAAALTVEGALNDGAEEVELSTLTIDYLPGHSEQRGGLLFTQDPATLELRVRATGYQEP